MTRARLRVGVTCALSGLLLAAACNGEAAQRGARPLAPDGEPVQVGQPVRVGAEAGARIDAEVRAGIERQHMVEATIMARGVTDERVLAAMRRVPRHRFVPEDVRALAHEDRPLPIGHGQTISQPYIVAFMTAAVAPRPGDKVLEVGTGSGYQAAVLAELGARVFSIEIVEPLAERAAADLAAAGYDVAVRAGDGYRGWPDEAPFDVIVITAAPDHVPPALVEQLAPGGRLCLPVGPEGAEQQLRLITKAADGSLTERTLLPVRFVPMTGEARDR